MKRKVCVITGTRAEYGLLQPLIEEIKNDSSLELQLIVTGMHLSPEFGLTYREIERAGYTIDEKIEILLSSDTSTGISKSMGLALIGFAEAYKRLDPHLIIGLGDRFELFSAVTAAHVAQIPVAHLHGGEVTEGAFDDAFRHSITKMSQLHFTSTEEYRRRVIQLGESPERVFNVGAIGLDNIKNLPLLAKKDLEKDIDFKFGNRNLLVTFHPVTLEKGTAEEQFQNLLSALDELQDTTFIFTKANADTDGRIINGMIDSYVAENSNKAIAFTSMGQLRYLSAMKHSDAVVGNSSSGVIEAPSFNVGTINIGDRQKGRIKPESIIDCEPVRQNILEAINILLSKDFQESLNNLVNPYGKGDTAKQIKNIIKIYSLSSMVKKGFFDMPYNMTEAG